VKAKSVRKVQSFKVQVVPQKEEPPRIIKVQVVPQKEEPPRIIAVRFARQKVERPRVIPVVVDRPEVVESNGRTREMNECLGIEICGECQREIREGCGAIQHAKDCSYRTEDEDDEESI
jgi:hypothetical protein